MKTGKPKLEKDKGGAPKIDWFAIFADARKAKGGAKDWVAVYQWKTKDSAWRARRALERRDAGCEVPGGIGKWELAVDWDEKGDGKIVARLWVRWVG